MSAIHPIPNSKNFVNRIGQRFGKLFVVSYAGKASGGGSAWNCICDCGKDFLARGRSLQQEDTTSCGCFRNIVHGCAKSPTPEYASWTAMIKRCFYETAAYYPDYGGRGITVCDEWRHSFPQFLADMGKRPRGHSLDRIDNDGPYSPANCRWANQKTQCRNKRSNVIVDFDGKSQCLSTWAEQLGFAPYVLSKRLRAGWSVEKTLTTPVRKR